MSSAVAKFVSKVAVHFPPPKFAGEAEEAEWMGSIVASLKAYDEDVLRRAAQQIIDTRGLRDGEKWFPVPAAIRKVCADIKAQDEMASLPLDKVPAASGKQDGGSHRYRTAYLLIDGPMGREAAQDGWVLPLFWWVVRNGSLPSPDRRGSFRTLERSADGGVHWETVSCSEVEWVKRAARMGRDAYAECVRGNGGYLQGALMKLGESMQQRERELAAKVLGENVAA